MNRPLHLFVSLCVTGTVISGSCGCAQLGAKKESAQTVPTGMIDETKVKLTPYKPEKPTAQMLSDFGFYELAAERPDKAKEYFDKALAAEKRHIPALVGLAKMANAKKDSVEAKKYVEEGLKISQKSADLWNELAVAEAVSKNYPAALAAIQKAIDIDPKNNGYKTNHAGMLATMGQYEQAYKVYREVYSAGETRYRLAGVMNQQGKKDQALAQLEQGLKEEPGHQASIAALTQLSGSAVQRVGYTQPVQNQVKNR